MLAASKKALTVAVEYCGRWCVWRALEFAAQPRRANSEACGTHLLTPIPPPGPRGYEPKYRMLESAIKKLAPTAAVTGKTGRVSSFEVVVDGTVVYSKLATGAFPDFTKLAAQIAQ